MDVLNEDQAPLLDETTVDFIKALAKQTNRSPNTLIQHALSNYAQNIPPTDAASDTSSAIEASHSAQRTTTAVHQSPFTYLRHEILPQSQERARITDHCRTPETEIVPNLLAQARVPEETAQKIHRLAQTLCEKLRENSSKLRRNNLAQGVLQTFSLSSQEGIALMCLAEALLRIPDKATRDLLIRDKIGQGNWQNQLGQGNSLFINATTWGLVITGKIVAIPSQTGLKSTLNRLLRRGGKPLIRKSVDLAMRLLGTQFVAGETITKALSNVRQMEEKGFCYSYDMLGEAALTYDDAKAYFDAYQQAICAIGTSATHSDIYARPGISIKLSALHPRYCRAQYRRVMTELYPALKTLVLLARQHNIAVNIDAEEAARLELSLDLLEKLCFEADLAHWHGIGFVVQAYQKRCPFVIDRLIDIAKRSQKRVMVRLVKGAYWDSEIKQAQLDGLDDYPVYTRKVYTDLSYLACARKLLAETDAIYPQFATHNAQTLASIYHLAGEDYTPGQYEFQALYGMGEPLYSMVVGNGDNQLGRPCRLYAPVGSHATLLAYLVRRLLENGANTSFVNHIVDPAIPVTELITSPVDIATALAASEGCVGLPHPQIPSPRAIYAAHRPGAAGIDLNSEQHLTLLADALMHQASGQWSTRPLTTGWCTTQACQRHPILNPANTEDIVGYCVDTDDATLDKALTLASAACDEWSTFSPEQRAAILLRAADKLETDHALFIGLLVREAGKTLANAIAEIREAVDFLRYYALQVRTTFDNATHRPLGVVVCISPWNFPLAIFIGQIAAALAAGNCVIAKPAEQTPLIASEAAQRLLQAGVPTDALQLLPGQGETVGARLVSDTRTQGVMFTGSTDVAITLQRTLAQRLNAEGKPVPLIAETGGINAMIVDSSALTEQVVTDIITSAFDSAGQRCSALRLLCIQEEAAETTLTMLRNAINELCIGDPRQLATDYGPVIEQQAKETIEQYIIAMRNAGNNVWQATYTNHHPPYTAASNNVVPPTIIEIKAIDQLNREIFGPVLHIVRFKQGTLTQVVTRINALGYGLTMGLHTRIEETVQQVTALAEVGNLYINRNMVGAVVGVQPFGGEGLSGTGPKAGGPLYLYRLLAAYPLTAPHEALHSTAVAQGENREPGCAAAKAHHALLLWASESAQPDIAELCRQYRSTSLHDACWLLPGPTGEHNTYTLLPKKRVWCIADLPQDRLIQLAAIISAGCRVLWQNDAVHRDLYHSLPKAVQARIDLYDQPLDKTFDAVVCHATQERILTVCQHVAARHGAIVGVEAYAPGETAIRCARLLIERAISINTAAAGGNTRLMTLDASV